MKLAVSSYSLNKPWAKTNTRSMEQTIDWLAEAGVGAVEIAALEEPWNSGQAAGMRKAKAIAKRCEKLGLEVAGYCVGGELLISPAMQKAEVTRLKRQVDIAAALGVKSMRHDVTRGFEHYQGYRGAKTFAGALKVIVPAIREVADYGQECGVVTTLENHGYFMQAAARVEKLLDTVDHPNFRLTLDMGNFLCVDDDPVAAVKRLAKRAVMVHAKDFHVKPKKKMPGQGWSATPKSIAIRGAIVGHGDVDVVAQLKLLKSAKYQGFLSLEFEGMEEPTLGVSAGLAYLKKQMEVLGIK